MSKPWLDRAFGTVGTIVSEARHELIDRGWFGRNFSPPAPGQYGTMESDPAQRPQAYHFNTRIALHVGDVNTIHAGTADLGWFSKNFSPSSPGKHAPERSESTPGERDIHGNERGIDR